MSSIERAVEGHVTLTGPQREAIDLFDFEVTFEFGHVCIMTKAFAAKLVGARAAVRQGLVATNDPTEGRVHDDPQHFDELLDSMVEVASAQPRYMQAENGDGTTEEVVEVKRTPRKLPAKQAAKVVEAAVAATTKAVAANPQAHAPAPKSGGVIAAMVALLSDGNKRTRDQLYQALALQFPDRASETGGMRVTIGVQLNKLREKHNIQSHKTDGSPAVYWI